VPGRLPQRGERTVQIDPGHRAEIGQAGLGQRSGRVREAGVGEAGVEPSVPFGYLGHSGGDLLLGPGPGQAARHAQADAAVSSGYHGYVPVKIEKSHLMLPSRPPSLESPVTVPAATASVTFGRMS
jgi:hypothetical protein